MKVKSGSEVAQSCPTLSDPMDCSLPDSSVHGIFQAEVLEWGAIAFSAFQLKHLQRLYLQLRLQSQELGVRTSTSLGGTQSKPWQWLIHKVSLSLDVSYNVKAQLSPAALIPSEGLHRDISLETHREGKTRVWGLGRQSSAKHSAHVARVHTLCSHGDPCWWKLQSKEHSCKTRQR